jgi:hypothetical protein
MLFLAQKIQHNKMNIVIIEFLSNISRRPQRRASLISGVLYTEVLYIEGSRHCTKQA